MELNIILPSRPKIISENDSQGIYEIEGLYPGYGQTLGNSLRRIILSSIAGVAITSLKVTGADHEFSTLPGVKEDVLAIILNLKKIHFKLSSDEPQTATIQVKGVKVVTGADIVTGGQVEVVNPEQVIATLTDKSASLELALTLEKGIGYVPKEVLQQTRPAAIGTIVLDAAFTPIRRVSYEVDNMRVGDRTDYNRLRLNVETNKSISPHEALEKSIEIMINQLRAIVGFKEETMMVEETEGGKIAEAPAPETAKTESDFVLPSRTAKDVDLLKTRVEDLTLPPRITRALALAGIRTIGGLARKRESDLAEVDGLGAKAIDEIKKLLKKHDLELKV
ncbi:MAG: DNA-directed RNA polymerase subunit alpha [Candidatus Vogelbacteria bacterium]|nr:DNA-directed RNA polymerase subunit alpha [Candidatus Vogelbacteria bacterium]